MSRYRQLARLAFSPLFLASFVLLLAVAARAEVGRVLPAGQFPQDARLGPLKNLDGYFPFTPCTSPEQWAKRAERVRRQLLVAAGLWPMPTKTPAHAVIHGAVDRGQYTVEKVYLESYPGHFVTGNLYRPKGRTGRLPAVMCPHGHWPNGRFMDIDEKSAEKQISTGAEKFLSGAHSPLQARCAQLARLGCIVFHYDMVGYADSVQLVHRPGVRAEMNTAENWGLFSPQAELRMQNFLGLQAYNSIRVLDWLGELPEVDPQRIGVTGASGGGTQTFLLCAIDPRPAVAFPAVMVSTAMQGGCTCENACYLRVGTGNVEIAAMIAPRPLGMSAANDWTKEIETKGLPELKQHYAMLGVPDRVEAKAFVQFPHNYNYVSRAVMYEWMNKHLKLAQKEPIVEPDFRPLSTEEMSVWDQYHPKPLGGDDYERSLLKWMTQDAQKQIAALTPHDAATLAEYRRVVGGAVDVMIGRGLPAAGAVEAASRQDSDQGEWRVSKFLIRYATAGEEVPAVRLQPKSWNKRVVIWIDKLGKGSLFAADGTPRPAVQQLLKAGTAVVGLDLMGQGEFTSDGKPLAKARMVADKKVQEKNKKGMTGPIAAFTYGYNHPLFSERVHDILSAVALLRSGAEPAEKVYLVGLAGAGHWVAAACAQAGQAVDGAAIDTGGFRFASLTAVDDPDFLPGAVKYGDLPGILALGAPLPIWLAGERELPAVVAAAYQAAAKPNSVSVLAGPAEGKEAAAVAWLLK